MFFILLTSWMINSWGVFCTFVAALPQKVGGTDNSCKEL